MRSPQVPYIAMALFRKPQDFTPLLQRLDALETASKAQSQRLNLLEVDSLDLWDRVKRALGRVTAREKRAERGNGASEDEDGVETNLERLNREIQDGTYGVSRT